MKLTKPVPANHVRILSLLLFFSLLVRLGLIWVNFNLLTCGLEVLQDDSVYNYKVARNIVQGLGFSFEKGEPIYAYHPSSVLFIIPFIMLFPNDKEIPIQCLLTLYSLISLATTLFVYRIVRKIYNESAALLSAGFWVLCYGIVIYSINGADTPLTIFLLAIAFDYYLRNIQSAQTPRTMNYAVLGVLCGFCILSRMDTLALLPAFGLHIIWSNRQGLFWKGLMKIAIAVSVMALTIAITTSPLFVRNKMLYGHFQVHNASSNRTLSIVMGHYARTLGIDKILYMQKHNIHRTPLNPMVTTMEDEFYPVWWGLYAFCAVKGIAVLPVKYGDIVLPLFFFLSILLWKSIRRDNENVLSRFARESGVKKLNVVLLYVVIHFCLYVFYQFSFWHTSRYMYPLAFAATLYLGPVTIWMLENIAFLGFARRFHVQRATLTLFGVLILSMTLQIYLNLYKNLCEGGNGFIQAANWINEHTPKDAVIGTYQGGYFGYYLDRTYHDLGGKATVAAWDAWLSRHGWDYIQKKNIDYIMDEDFYLDFVFAWSKMYPLTDKLELVNDEFGRTTGSRILIFKVIRPKETKG